MQLTWFQACSFSFSFNYFVPFRWFFFSFKLKRTSQIIVEEKCFFFSINGLNSWRAWIDFLLQKFIAKFEFFPPNNILFSNKNIFIYSCLKVAQIILKIDSQNSNVVCLFVSKNVCSQHNCTFVLLDFKGHDIVHSTTMCATYNLLLISLSLSLQCMLVYNRHVVNGSEKKTHGVVTIHIWTSFALSIIFANWIRNVTHESWNWDKNWFLINRNHIYVKRRQMIKLLFSNE